MGVGVVRQGLVGNVNAMLDICLNVSEIWIIQLLITRLTGRLYDNKVRLTGDYWGIFRIMDCDSTLSQVGDQIWIYIHFTNRDNSP